MMIVRRGLVSALLGSLALLAGSYAATGQSTNGALVAIDTGTGREQWRVVTAGSFTVSDVSSTNVVGRSVPCDSTSVRLTAIGADGGRRQWQSPKVREDDTFVRGGDSLAGGSTRSGVMISATDHRVRGIDATTGKTRWSAGTNTAAFIAMNSNTVVLADTVGEYPDGHAEVSGIDRKSGMVLWSMPGPDLNGRAVATLDSESEVAMFSSPDEQSIHAKILDPRSGKTLWEITGGEVIPAGSVVVLSSASRESGLLTRRVFDAHTGEELWSRTSGLSSSFSVVTPAGKRLAFVDDDGLTVVDARTGNELWTRPGGIRIAADRRSIAAREGRTVTILDAANGTARLDPILLPEGYEAVNTFVLAGRTLYAGLGCTPND